MHDDDLLETLLDVERRGWDSLCEGTGSGFYGLLATEDAIMVLANGMIMDRDTVVGALEDSPPWRTYEIESPRLVRTGVDGATLVYIGKGYREGDEPAFVGAMSSVYVNIDDRWRLVLYQQTPIPAA